LYAAIIVCGLWTLILPLDDPQLLLYYLIISKELKEAPHTMIILQSNKSDPNKWLERQRFNQEQSQFQYEKDPARTMPDKWERFLAHVRAATRSWAASEPTTSFRLFDTSTNKVVPS
jgi:hypothetical protein